MGLDIESASLDAAPLWGLDEDVKKYHDSIVREIICNIQVAIDRISDQIKIRMCADSFLMDRTTGPSFGQICDGQTNGRTRPSLYTYYLLYYIL